MQSIYSDVREIELLETLDDIEWDILLLSETWRKTKQEILKTERGHLFLGSGWDAGHKGIAILIHRRHTKTFEGFMPESERICAVDLDILGERIRIIQHIFQIRSRKTNRPFGHFIYVHIS